MIVLDVGGIESMGVVWDLIVTRVADNHFGWEAWNNKRKARKYDGRSGERIAIAMVLSGLTGLQTLDLSGT